MKCSYNINLFPYFRQIFGLLRAIRVGGVCDPLPLRAVSQLAVMHRRPLALRLQRRFRIPAIMGHTTPSIRGDQGKKCYLKVGQKLP